MPRRSCPDRNPTCTGAVLAPALLAAAGLLLAASLAVAAPQQFVIISDTQNIEGVDRMLREIIQLNPPFIISVGDVPSAFDPRVDLFRRLRESGIPIHIAMGNHDGGTKGAVRSCLPPYPFNDEVDPALRFVVENKYYYSFNRGGIHFVIVDTNASADDGEQESQWLEADLVRHVNNPKKYPTLLFMHNPAWMIGKDARTGSPLYRVLAAYPDQHTVRAAFAGDTHNGKHYPAEETLAIPLYSLYPSAPFGNATHTEYIVTTVAPKAITFERKAILDEGRGKDFVIQPVKGEFGSLDK
jgi:hypothetical protein